jgi:hypothetical protein
LNNGTAHVISLRHRQRSLGSPATLQFAGWITGIANIPPPLAAAIATSLAIATSGFSFGVSNNVYQIPFVLDFPAMPQFASDAYVQSLRSYGSLVWWLERQIVDEQNARTVFLVSYVLSIWLYFVSLFYVLGGLTRLTPLGRATAALIMAAAPLDTGYSSLGDHGLVAGYFEHTELATPVVLFAMALALRRRISVAVVLLGVALDINLFVAIWGGVAVLAVSIWLGRSGPASRVLLRGWLLGGAVAAVIASPVLVWTIRSIANGGSFQGDTIAFLRLLYPNHFLIDSASPRQLFLLLCTIVLGLTSVTVLDARGLRAAFLGFVAVFAFGCLAPYLTHSLLLLNLHLLRVDGFLQILAAVAAVAVVMRDLDSPNTTPARAIFAGAVAVCLLSRYLLPVAAALMLARALWRPPGRLPSRLSLKPPRIYLVVLIAAMAVLGVREARPHAMLEPEPQHDKDFVALAEWARADTRPRSVFLVNGEPYSIFDKFEMFSQRQVWFFMRQIAAVLWYPRFWPTWQQRYALVSALHTPEQRLAFACRAQIDYYVDHLVPGFELHSDAVAPFIAFENTSYFAIDARRYCDARAGS